MKRALILLLAVVAPRIASAQTFQIHITASQVPMTWHSDLFASLASISVGPTSHALGLTSTDRSSIPRNKVAWRLVKAIVFDAPVAGYFVSWNHEYGHVARANEAGIPTSLKVVGAPWTYPRFQLVATADYPRTRPLPGQSVIDLGTEAGGLEASWVMKDRLEREARSHSLTVGQTMAVVWASLNTPLYVQVNTPSDMFQHPALSGDVSRYAWQWINDVTRVEPRDQSQRLDELRHRSLLSLVDAELVASVYGLMYDYVWMGRETIDRRRPSVFGVGISPSLRYALTPIGPELSVRSQIDKGTSSGYFYYRQTERSVGGQASGVGFEYSLVTKGRFQPRLQIDTWQQPISGRGVRGEFALRFQSKTSGGASDRYFEIALGHKSRGYLQGQVAGATTSVSGSFGARW